MEKTDVYELHQSFFGFSGISSDEVNNGFVALMSDAPVHVVETFTDYVLETFIHENSSFLPYLWIHRLILGQQMDPKHFV
jgi:hypothetical protein